MYCPVDGIEWREGITRCPEHDVDLVDEPPEEDEDDGSLLDGFRSDRLVKIAVNVIVAASVLYAVSGVLLTGWIVLARSRDESWVETGLVQALQFVQPAALAVGLGALACLVAGVLGRVWTHLGAAPAPAANEEEADEDVEDVWAEQGPAGWIVALLSSLVIVFVVVWAATGVAISWEDASRGAGVGFPFPGEEEGPTEAYVNLAALHNAAYTCGFGALVAMGALLMERTYYRMRTGT